jgi:hypothetical protein
LVRDIELHTGAPYVIIGRKGSIYSRILLGMVSGESLERRGNILRKVPVVLWRMVCKYFVKSSLESSTHVLLPTSLKERKTNNTGQLYLCSFTVLCDLWRA